MKIFLFRILALCAPILTNSHMTSNPHTHPHKDQDPYYIKNGKEARTHPLPTFEGQNQESKKQQTHQAIRDTDKNPQNYEKSLRNPYPIIDKQLTQKLNEKQIQQRQFNTSPEHFKTLTEHYGDTQDYYNNIPDQYNNVQGQYNNYPVEYSVQEHYDQTKHYIYPQNTAQEPHFVHQQPYNDSPEPHKNDLNLYNNAPKEYNNAPHPYKNAPEGYKSSPEEHNNFPQGYKNVPRQYNTAADHHDNAPPVQPVPVYVNNYGKDDHSSPDIHSFQYSPFPDETIDSENDHGHDDYDQALNFVDRETDEFVSNENPSDSLVDVGFHEEEVLNDDNDYFSDEDFDGNGNFGMYFDKKYQERHSAQIEFENEVQANIDNRVQNEYLGVDEENLLEGGQEDFHEIVETESEFSFDSPHENEYSERAEDAHQLEYDQSKNTELDLLDHYHEETDDDLFTFNANEIYVTDPHDREDRDPFDQNQVKFDGFGNDDLFFPQKVDRSSLYDKDFYDFYQPSPSVPEHQPHPPLHLGPGRPHHRADHRRSSPQLEYHQNDAFPDIFSESISTSRPAYGSGF